MLAVVAGGGLFLMLDHFQESLIFPVDAVPRAGPLRPGAQAIAIDTADGARLHGVLIAPSRPKAGESTLVVGFGGNAWNGQHVAEYLHDLYPQAHVAAFHYRGYRPSTGRPSAKSLIEDAPAVLDAVSGRVDCDRIVVVGFSIGSGIAASLARRDDIDGLILVTPFDSLKAVAADMMPWVPIGPLFRHDIDSSAFLEGTTIPVAIVAAERDDIVRPRRTKALRDSAPNLVFDRTIAGAGHNDLYARSEFQAAMDEALVAMTGKTG